MKNHLDQLNSEEINKTKSLTVWLGWYEDRFGWGDDRDPAVPLDAFLTEAEADAYVMAHGGEIDTASGKFDGRFTDKSNLFELLYLNLISIDRARELIKEAMK